MSKFSNPHVPYQNTPQYSTQQFEDLMAKQSIGYTVKEFDDLLQDLQANILLFHRRNFSRFYFIHFNNDPAHLKDAIKWTKEISESGLITSAKEQFEQKGEKKPICCFYLTWEGYRTLGLERLAPSLENNKAFEQGMRERVGFPLLPINNEEKLHPMVEGARGSIHALLMIASDKPDFSDVDNRLKLSKTIGDKKNDWGYVTIQNGLIKKRDFDKVKGKIVEWFGFRDGVSQPLFFPDAHKIDKFDGDSVAPLKMVLTRDRGGKHWYSSGSFLAFLKLEQNVKKFYENVEKIAPNIKPPDKVLEDIDKDKGIVDKEKEKEKITKELAGAYIMGRFQDGTPVSLSGAAKKYEKDILPENDFQYSKIHVSNGDSNVSDEKGIRCPFAAHARKANPRDDNEGRYIVRRGVLYDDRPNASTSNDLEDWEKLIENGKELPPGEIGLLFMSFQRSLEEQFEHILNNWLLSVNTGAQATGVDMLAGTGFNRQFSRWYLPKKWGEEDANEKTLFTPDDLEECVKFRGGEYFFAPSISFLANIESLSPISFAKNGGLNIPVITRK